MASSFRNLAKKTVTPTRKEIKTEVSSYSNLPFANVITIHERQANSSIANKLASANATLSKRNNIHADFIPNPNCGVLYLSENQMTQGMEQIKSLLEALKKFERPIILAHKSSLTEPYLNEIQIEAVLKQGLFFLPISSETEVVRIILKLMRQGRVIKPISKVPKVKFAQNSLVQTICTIPSVSKVRAQSLISHFDSLYSLTNAPLEELANVDKVGKKAGENIYSFFRKPFDEE